MEYYCFSKKLLCLKKRKSVFDSKSPSNLNEVCIYSIYYHWSLIKMNLNYVSPLINGCEFFSYVLQYNQNLSLLNLRMQNHRYRGKTAKLYADFQLHGGLTSLNPILVKGQYIYLEINKYISNIYMILHIHRK